MAKCKICGGRIADGAAKCPTCGTPVGSTAESLQPKPQARQTPPAQQQVPPAQQQTPPTYGGTTGYSSQAQAAPQPPVQPVQQTVTVQIPPPPVSPQTSQYATSGDATENELINAYITGNAGGIPTTTHALEHYRDAFRGPISWNWATAFTSWLNLFYRRCWGWALLTCLISGLCTLIPGGPIVGYVVFFIIMGLAGDRIIYSRYNRTIQKARSLYPGNKSIQLSYVATQGGTRTALVITLSVLSLIFAIIGILTYGTLFLYQLGSFMEKFGWPN
ncbi:MAG: hypothetical protein K6G18_02250 [Treponema sp.]|nr:hypothetical protein [Treponema sp.]